MFAVLATLWLAFFRLGCERTQHSREAGIASEARSEPILKIEDDAKTILRKAVIAHGGDKAFSRWSCGRLKYKTKNVAVPAELGEVIVEDAFELPGHFKRVTHMNVGGKDVLTVYVINHGKGWIKKGDAPAEPLDNDFTDRTEHPFAGLCNLAALTAADVRLTKLGADNVNGKNAIGIRAQSAKLGEVDFYFDSQTGLLIKSRKLLTGADPDKPRVMESFLDGYKGVQGVQLPMRIKGMQDSKTILDVTLIDARFADKLEEGTFAKP
jgi:hypothetical protein